MLMGLRNDCADLDGLVDWWNGVDLWDLGLLVDDGFRVGLSRVDGARSYRD